MTTVIWLKVVKECLAKEMTHLLITRLIKGALSETFHSTLRVIRSTAGQNIDHTLSTEIWLILHNISGNIFRI